MLLANATPASCNAQVSDKVHAVAAVSGPASRKLPSRNAALLACPQHTMNAALASPAVAVPKLKTRNGDDEAATAKAMPL